MPVDISLTRTTEAGRQRCAFCHEIVPSADVVACDGCRVGLHAECWRELVCCPTPGCAVSAAPVRRPQRCVACDRELRAGERLACADCRVGPKDLTTWRSEVERVQARRLSEHLAVEPPPRAPRERDVGPLPERRAAWLRTHWFAAFYVFWILGIAACLGLLYLLAPLLKSL